MPLPIAGEVEVVVGSANPVAIHGDPYVDLAVFAAGDESPTMVRVPAAKFPAVDGEPPRLPGGGDRLVLTVLLGQVDAVRMPDPA
ncbi:MAG: hypothetical protein VX726_12660 [Planctomycetota bacterium]|nr:hypothetical protein [Planctomycetota bacterium]MEE2896576.1 hypothetical protein [Planctomycetota bacterium]